MNLKSLRVIATLAVILALLVVMLGAYTRLTDAGLGCPDWPGCYGKMVLPSAQVELASAQKNYANLPINERRAWTEMVHRYAAGSLATLILLINIGSIFVLRQATVTDSATVNYKLKQSRAPILLLGLVVFQAMLGMWTVTLKLLPVVVMGHLLGGVLIFATLVYFRWQISNQQSADLPVWRFWIGVGLFIVFFQIALGGWVSSNYAGVACVGFPRCSGQWIPSLHFSSGFNLFAPIGANYQGGVLDNHERMSIQFIHRLGALLTATYVFILASLIIFRAKAPVLRRMAAIALVLIGLQFTLGILNVVYLLPLWVAVGHNGVAALLLATMFSLFYLSKGDGTRATLS